ncbi:hypothetical protein G6F23_013592 [Rhizopus arrhizus]|nr:hypothetical protein G6F23_013592 [Rhizopus arrhizus]
MDGATEPTWTYLRRPPQPDPSRHPTDSPLLLLLRLLLLLLLLPAAGAGRSPADTPFPEHSAHCFERRAHAGHGTLSGNGTARQPPRTAMTLHHLPLRSALLLALSALPLAALAEASSPAPTRQVPGVYHQRVGSGGRAANAGQPPA